MLAAISAGGFNRRSIALVASFLVCLLICGTVASSGSAAASGLGSKKVASKHGALKKQKRKNRKRYRAAHESNLQAPGAKMASADSPVGSGVEPYSKDPSGDRPYAVCPPPTARRVTCLAADVPIEGGEAVVPLELEGSGENGGYSAADLQAAYDIAVEGGEGLTVAITIAYDNPNAEEDLAVYREANGLPPCTTKNGCFTKVNQYGEAGNYPFPNPEWALETSLDLDMVSAACPECDILLVEAESNLLTDMTAAVETAAELGADAISNSWAAGEHAEEVKYNESLDHPGVPVLFASGDWGYEVLYPAASPHVVAVGGTSLNKDESSRGWGEVAWGGAGSGCAAHEAKPRWQVDEGCLRRTVADVGAVADPETPVAVYDSFEYPGWVLIGGTSAAAPLVAGIEAVSSPDFRAAGPRAFTAVGEDGQLFDVEEGINGLCENYLCEAGPGYDGPTGWGTPVGTLSLPTAFTETAKIESSNKALLRGSVAPGGLKTEYHFEYGPTTAYGTSVPVPSGSTSAGPGYIEVSQLVEGLNPSVVYHYRLVATNSKGTFNGADRTFATAGPTVKSQSATDVTSWEATLRANIDSGGKGFSYHFEYGPTSSYGKSTAKLGKFSPGGSSVDVSQRVDALPGGSTYHYRVVAESAGGKSYGPDKTLTTSAPLWERQSSPAPGAFSSLQNVSCADATTCVATGFTPNPGGWPLWNVLAEHWDGETWSVESVPRVEDAVPSLEGKVGNETISDIDCPTVNFCAAVGSPWLKEDKGEVAAIWHWDGSEWAVDPVPTTLVGQHPNVFLTSVSCVSASMCMAVGTTAGEGLRPMDAISLVWDGTEWDTAPVPTPEKYSETRLDKVQCLSATWCIAFGAAENMEPRLGDGMSVTWDGTKWQTLDVGIGSKPSTFFNESAVSCFKVGSAELGCWSGRSGIKYFENDHELEEFFPVTGVDWWIGENRFEEASCSSPDFCAMVGAVWASYEPLEIDNAMAIGWEGSEWSRRGLDVATMEPDGTPTITRLNGVDCPVTGLCVAVGAYRSSESEDLRTLVTIDSRAPGVTTEAATAVKTAEATLNGTVDPEGFATDYWFEYGKTTSYGTKIPVSPKAIGSGTSNVAVSQTPTGLTPGTTYHYRVVAENELGLAKGADKTLVTGKAPKATSEAATGIEPRKATLNATVNPEGAATDYWFEYGKTTSYGTKIPASPKAIGSGTSGVAVSQTPSGLAMSTTYHYRVVAESANGTTHGKDLAFRTAQGPVWLHNDLALRDEAVANYAGDFAFENENGEIGCAVEAAFDLAPGDDPAAIDFEIGGEGKDCEAGGPLVEVFGCTPKSASAGGSATAAPGGEDVVLADVGFTYQMNGGCLLGGEIVVECEAVTATPDQMTAIAEIDLTEDYECESNFGPVLPTGTLEKEAPAAFQGSVAFELEGAGVECEVGVGLDLGPANNGAISGFLAGGDGCETIGVLGEGGLGCEVSSSESKSPLTVSGHGPVLRIAGVDLAFAMKPGCGIEELTVSCQPLTAEVDDIALIGKLDFLDETGECEDNVFGTLFADWEIEGPATGTFGFGTLPPDWAAENPPTGGEPDWSVFTDVSCQAIDDCVAVGGYEPKAIGDATPLAAAWDGSEWSSQALPLPAGRVRGVAGGVACPSSQACVAVGYTGKESGPTEPLVNRWNGTSWVAEVPPVPVAEPSYAVLNDVDCAFSNWCVGVGLYKEKGAEWEDVRPYAVRWNGANWSLLTAALPSGVPRAMLYSVDCVEWTFVCIGVGGSYGDDSLVERWSGTTNTASTLEAESLAGVSCLSASSCVATGTGGLWSYSGSEWTPIEGPYLSELEGAPKEEPEWPEEEGEQPLGLGDISCLAAEECVTATLEDGEVLRWAGGEWSRETGPASGEYVSRLQCLAPAACIGVGIKAGEAAEAALTHLNLTG